MLKKCWWFFPSNGSLHLQSHCHPPNHLTSAISQVLLTPSGSSLVIPISPEGFPGGASDKESACQCRRHKRCGSDPWVGKIPWRRKWHPTPVLLPGKCHGQRSLAGYSPQGHRESDVTERTHTAYKTAHNNTVCPKAGLEAGRPGRLSQQLRDCEGSNARDRTKCFYSKALWKSL